MIVGAVASEKEEEAPDWPGMVFANSDLSYEEAMHQYTLETRDRLEQRKVVREPQKTEGDSAWRKEWDARSERYQVRKQREEQDADWKTAKANRRTQFKAYQALSRQARKEQRTAYEQAEENWKICREERQKTLEQREQEDREWHLRNQERKENGLPERTWIAILVAIDNCSRQCLGLPIFCSGAHVTSEEVVTALHTLLPADLAFLISDQGVHFRSKVFAQLAKEEGFIHVPIYRHRPESNGIAERFVLRACKRITPHFENIKYWVGAA